MNSQEVQKEIEQELSDINDILFCISKELKEIKNMTHPSGDISKLLRKNAMSMQSLAKFGNIEIDLSKSLMEHSTEGSQSLQETQMSHLLHDSFREDSFN